MSYFLVYAVSDTAPPADGPHIASSKGWFDFGTWVLARAAAYPEAAHLARHGWLDDETPGSLAKLDAELPRLEAEAARSHPDVAGVARHLAGAVKARPAGAVGVLVTDGEPGDEADPEGDVYG